MSGIRLLVVLIAIAWTVARLSGPVVAAAWRARTPSAGSLVHPWSRWAPYLLGLPVLLGVGAAVGCIIPSHPSVWLAGECPCEVFPAEGMHLCIFHPGASAPLFPVGLAALLLLSLDAMPGLAAFVRSFRAVRRLVATAVPGPDVLHVDLGGAAAAFTSGIASPGVYVDGAWWARLAPAEQRLVLAHEGSHARHGDPAVRVALELIRLLVAPRAAAGMVEAWRLSAELRADREAAVAVGDPIRVARFLVAQARCARPSLALGLSADGLECRVRALLDGRVPESAPSRAVWVAFSAAMLVELALLGPLLHRGAELYMNSRH